jgi:alpha-L-arabinofuranosidase
MVRKVKPHRSMAWSTARWMIERLESRRLLSVGPIPAVPTPTAHWAFDDGSGTTAVDSTGNGYTAALGTGITWVTGNVGTHAISLNGSSTAVATVTGPVVNTSGSFTASAWVDLASLSGYQTVVSIAGTNVAGFFLQYRSDTGTFAFTRLASDSTSAATTYVAAPAAPVTGTWYHIVGVDDATAGTLTLYVDGQSQGSAAYTTGWTANGNTYIGHGFYGGTTVDYVDGSIDDVQLFSSALSAAQVVALDQPADYSFDDGTGGTASDVSGHGNTLTLGSGASWAAGYIGSNSLAVKGTLTGNATYPSPVINTAQSFTVSAWVNLTSVSGYQTFVSIDGTNTSGFYLQLNGGTGDFDFARLGSDSDSATNYQAASTTPAATGTWYNLVGVNDVATGQLILYVNGVLQSTVSYSNGWQATGATVIGAGLFNGVRTNFVSGNIDDVHFYDSPLSAGDAAYIGTNGNSLISVAAGTSGITVSPHLFGAMIEDINYAAEGGIYNNEVRDSGFNDSTNALNGWAAVAGTGVTDSLTSDTTTGPTTALTQSGELTITSGVSATARAGISNSGYFGVAVAPSTSYSIMFYAMASAGFTGPLTVDLESTTGTVWATATISSISSSWAQYTATLTTNASTPTTATNLFIISTNSTSANGATIHFGATYVYPPSYDDAANHLRIDLMQDLATLKPAIFRVPGGNYLEGETYATRFEWSNTIGPVQDRPGHYNSAWGYWSTDGMGLDEYLQMAEEVGASPVLAVYAGYTLNGSSDTGTTLTNDVTDAVNELHYVLDPTTTSWGAERAANGHPSPYNVTYVEIGNEDFFSSTYSSRYPLFYNAIHAAFPQLQIVATSTSTGGSPYNVIDEHFYETPAWFEANSGYFNNVARGSSTVFIGEYASNQGSPTNDMNSALGDASWLLGLERNSDLVTMSSYAPLFVNVSNNQWTPDLIGFNNTTSYGSPSYWAQVILGQNHGTNIVSDTVSGASGLQTLVTRTGTTYYVTVVNTIGTANTATVNLSGVTTVSPAGTVTSLTGSSSSATNSITNPTNIIPVTASISDLSTHFAYTFPGYSITVIQLTASANPPTVATAAAASPSPVAGTTTNLSVLGSDATGESNLSYTWSATGPAVVTYSANGNNAAKESTATFTKAGTYVFQVAINNSLTGLSTTSSVTVTVSQTATTFAITPATITMAPGTTAQFAGGTLDQFGNVIGNPSINWSVVSGGGSINSLGVYTAGSTGGSVTINAASGSQNASATITVASTVAWYKADSSSGTTLTDSSGNGKNGTLTGTTSWGTGVSGNDITFGGGYATLPNGLVSSLTNFTISAWIKITSLVSWERIFDFGTGTTDYMFLTPDNGSTNTLRFAISTGGDTAEQQLNGPAITVGVWTHVAVTLAGSVGTLYVNGVAVATNNSMTLHLSSLGSTNHTYLGKSQFSGDPALAGSIDDFRIYNQALSAQQVLLLATPTVLVSAAASPLPVTGTTANLSVSATDVTAGQSVLTYTWATTGMPPAPVNFSVNGTNGAQNTTATFAAAGSYTLQVTTVNPAAGLSTVSTVVVTVAQTLTSIAVSPATSAVYDGQTIQFAAVGYDQFGAAMSIPPVFTWSVVSGGAGSISSTGLYTAPAAGPASDTVQASSGGVAATATATVNLSVINGTSGDDNIRLVANGGNLLVYINNASTPAYIVPTATVGSLSVYGGTGTDTINIDFSGGSTPVPSGGLLVSGTGGNDTLLVTGTTGNDAATISANSIAFDGSSITYSTIASVIINGNGGNDSVTQTAQPGNGATLTFNGTSSGGPSATDSLNVSGGIFNFAAPSVNAGIQPISLATLSVSSGADVSLGIAALHTDRSVLDVGSLSLIGTGKLDLGGNDLIVQTTAFSAINNALTTGYNGGTWNGSGIASAAAHSDTTHLTALGVVQAGTITSFDNQPVYSSYVLVKYTYVGDTNLDGTVDGSDYSRIDNGFLRHLTGWANGDFNYDGAVNGSDYTLIDNAFNTQGANLTAELAGNSLSTKTIAKELVTTGKLYVPSTAFQSTTPIEIAGVNIEKMLEKKDILDKLTGPN